MGCQYPALHGQERGFGAFGAFKNIRALSPGNRTLVLATRCAFSKFGRKPFFFKQVLTLMLRQYGWSKKYLEETLRPPVMLSVPQVLRMLFTFLLSLRSPRCLLRWPVAMVDVVRETGLSRVNACTNYTGRVH